MRKLCGSGGRGRRKKMMFKFSNGMFCCSYLLAKMERLLTASAALTAASDEGGYDT